ncbi:MAG TPA: N-acetylglucosamine-6-phosphate deacetylase, partial [Woeseiaceae bacterium]|nr:N-acetylglucosamine-6-phosphate deacetylase [Woeseiaceae bacterium]
MKSQAFVNCRALIGDTFRDGLAVLVEDGLIAGIVAGEKVPAAGVDVYDLDGKLLLPGFIDAQVNGGGGILFNDSPDIDGIRAIAKAHCQFGTTGFLPTLISDELDVLDRALLAVEEAIDEGVPGVLGVHIEGPFLNPQRRGVHDRKKLRQLTARAMSGLRPVRNGKTVLTLAPEAVEPGFIRNLVEMGFIVCAGHSDASYEDTIAALEQGLSGFTHLYNAMSQLSAREPGVVGAALDDRDSWCGVIADGHHVSPVSLRIAVRCKGPGRIMLVSDAMPPVGSSVTRFRLLDKAIEVVDGVCRDQHGTLAGTALDMASAVRNMMRL